MADEFAEDFLDDEELSKPSKAESAPGKKNNIILIGVVALVQTVLAIVIVDQFLLPARSEFMEANDELLTKIQAERAVIDRRIKYLEALQAGEELPDTILTDKERTGIDLSKEGFMMNIKDLIINPAGSNGERYILINADLEISTEEALAVMKEKEVKLRDRIIGVVSKKTIDQFDEYKELVELRMELKKELSKYLPEESEIYNIYFSNFLVQ
jgi:flagellar basal body-associated protein FliL